MMQGQDLTPDYKILGLLGEGTFGKVLECWDRRERRRVAVKVIRALYKYREAARLEIEVLETLRRADPEGRQPCIRLLRHFEYQGHVCMVFEKLGLSVFEFLRRNNYRPYPLDQARHIIQQLLQAVAFMHALRLVHTDLKPENLLLARSDYCLEDAPASSSSSPSSAGRARRLLCSEVKLIDFGSATCVLSPLLASGAGVRVTDGPCTGSTSSTTRRWSARGITARRR